MNIRVLNILNQIGYIFETINIFSNRVDIESVKNLPKL